VNWVKQEDANGCGPATAAMLLGISYREARDAIDAFRGPQDWNDGGCIHYDLDRLLYAAGYFKQTRYAAWGHDLTLPFAPMHYAMVRQPSNNSHFVAMLADGRVLDPLREGFWSLADWPEVNQVCGWARPLLP
jgi:hypothetical protein